MPTPTFITGFEHGVVVTGATPNPNDRIWHAVVTTGGTPGIDTTTPRSGARCLNIPATSGAASYVSRNYNGTPNIAVHSFAIRFVGSLPTADCMLVAASMSAGTFPSLWFNASDSKLYARVAANGATGFTVAANTWYLVDMKWDASTGTRTCDVTVNGTALGQASSASAAGTASSWRAGKNVATTTANGNIRYDDLVVSQTGADYPLGDHEVLKMSPNADGTHSFTANDFIRGDAGAAILTSDTDVWTLLDEVPFGAIGTTDSVQQNVIRTTGYVELALEAAPRAVDAWGIQIHGQYDADATGADTCTLKENDGGTLRDVYTGADVSNTTETFLSHAKATAPSGGVYTQAKLDALRLRWGFSGDVTGSPIVHALMVEAAFPVTAGDVEVIPGLGSATWEGFAPSVQTPRNVLPGVGEATWNGFLPSVTVGVNVTPGAGAATWEGFAPTVQTPVNVLPGVGAGTWTGFAPTVAAGVNVAPGVGAATWSGFAPTVQTPQNVTPGVGQASWAGFAPTVQTPRNVIPGPGAATWAGFAPAVTTSTHVVVRPETGEAQWQGFAPTVQGSVIVQEESGSGGRAKKARAKAQLLRGGLPVPTLRLGRLSVVNPARASLRRNLKGALDFGIGLRRGRIDHRSVLLGTLIPQASYRGTVDFAPVVREGRVIALAPLELDEMLEILGIYELTDG